MTVSIPNLNLEDFTERGYICGGNVLPEIRSQSVLAPVNDSSP